MKNVFRCRIRPCLRRIAALCLSTALLLGFSVYFPVQMKVSAVDTTKVTLYRWERVYTQSDLKTGNIIFMWGGDDGFKYSTRGQSYGTRGILDFTYLPGSTTSDYPELNPSIGGFYTTDTCDSWYLELTGGVDSDNGNVKKGKIYLSGKNRSIGWTGTDITFGDPLDFSLVTSDVNTDEGRMLSAGRIMVFHNDRHGLDEHLGPGKNYSTLEVWETKSNFTDLSMFVCVSEEWQVITSDVTVHSGTTLRLEDKYFLRDDARIIVEPGAVLSIDGQFLCNGNIENFGTVIYEENAYVHPFQRDSSKDSKNTATYKKLFSDTTENARAICNNIRCYGSEYTSNGRRGEGNVLVLTNALLEIAGTIYLYGGTSLVNSGILIVGKGINMKKAQFIQTGVGVTYSVYTLPNRHARRSTFEPYNPIRTEIKPGSFKIISEPYLVVNYVQKNGYGTPLYDSYAYSVIRCEGTVHLNGFVYLYGSKYEFEYKITS